MSTSSSRAIQLGAIGMLAVALGCAAFAAFLIARVVNSKGYGNDKTQPVVVAKHNLPAAQPLTEDDVDVVNWPEKHLPAGVVSDIKALFASGKPLIPTGAILEGEPIVPSRLANSGAGTGIAALVHEGYRAVAVKVDDAIGRSGLVYPGAHVDVVVTMKDQEGHVMTRVAVGDARVLAVEAETDVQTRRQRQPGENSATMTESNNQGYTGTVVTLEVGPEDSQVVSLAAKEGHIDLALRNGSDRGAASTKIVIPIEFSQIQEAVGLPMNLPPGVAPPPVKPGGRPGRPGDKRIELRAVDNAPKSSPDSHQEIETYHAR